ncbi:MAG: type I-U CRISPR-associated protein Cas7 [Alphaproteobacteria bacterium]|nr:type I-U CRISPR-associated protein Cas7 [Alphaproteobacteria bacterium]
MPLDLAPLKDSSRLLIEAPLRPLQGTRFQPTGFPNLGPARYSAPGGEEMLLVESAQSMANRLEATCWDNVNQKYVTRLGGVPFVAVEMDGKVRTSSVEVAHRLNSVYIEESDWFEKTFARELGFVKKGKKFERQDQSAPVDFRDAAKVIFKYDPGSLVHGVFLESIAGVIRFPRILSSFIEAEEINSATSGGVKNDSLQPEKREEKTAIEGYGNVPFVREEFTAKKIVAYFNLDLAQIRGYGLGPAASDFLTAFALYKIRVLLDGDMRLRTACDLKLDGEPEITRPAGFKLPSAADLESALPALVSAVAKEGLFADPPVTVVVYKKAKSKNSGKAEASGASDDDNDNGDE